jgi:hypothetical protein
MAKLNEKPIKDLISTLPKAKQSLGLALLDKAAFMDEELGKLQKILKEKGWVEEYQNGANQCGLKKSSEADVYNGMIKNYNSTLKQIADLFPAENKIDSGDPLMSFLKK